MKKWLQRCTMGMSSLTLQKNSGDSRMYSYWDLAWTKQKFKKWFFGQNFQNFWQNWSLIFCCTTSVGMLFLEFFANFLHERFLEIWLGQESVTDKRTDGRTDGRTYTEGKTIYVSRKGRHIIKRYFWFQHQQRICAFREGNDITVYIIYLQLKSYVYKGKSKIEEEMDEILHGRKYEK